MGSLAVFYMGGCCVRDRNNEAADEPKGDLLPGESQQGEQVREELERQESALRKQEVELADKLARHSALHAQLAEEQKNTDAAKKELSDVLTESEIYRANVQRLNATLKEREEAVAALQDVRREHERLLAVLKELEKGEDISTDIKEDEDHLQAEIEQSKSQALSANSEYDRLKVELEMCHQRLKEAENTVSGLEKKEVLLEQSLGEEVSKHENGKKQTHLKLLYWLTLRRIHKIAAKYVTIWSINARKTTATLKQAADSRSKREEFSQRLADLTKKNAELLCAASPQVEALLVSLRDSQQEIEQAEVVAPSIFSPLGTISEETSAIFADVDERAKRLAEDFSDDSETLHAAAKIEVCTEKSAFLQNLLAAIERAEQFIGSSESIVNKAQALIDETSSLLPQTQEVGEASRKAIASQETDLKKLTAAYETVLTTEQKERANKLACELADALNSLAKEEKLIGEAKAAQETNSDTLRNFRESTEKRAKIASDIEGEKTNIQKLQDHSGRPALPLTRKATEVFSALIEEEISATSTLPREVEAACENPAAASPEVSPVLREPAKPEEQEAEVSPAFKGSMQYRFPETSELSPEEALERVNSFFVFYESVVKAGIRDLPRVSVHLLDYLLASGSGKEQALRDLAGLSETLGRLSAGSATSYVSLLSRALGLNASPPMTELEAKMMAYTEALVRTSGYRYEKSLKGAAITTEEKCETGGRVYLVDAFKAIYLLFDQSPIFFQTVLEGIKPPGLSLREHLNFLVCFRLKELSIDSLRLFKQIDTDSSGKLSAEEFTLGAQRILSLWMSTEHFKLVYTGIDTDGSNSLSRIEFTKAVNFKEYYQKCESFDYTITKQQLLTAVLSPAQQWRMNVLTPIESEARARSEGRPGLNPDEVEAILRPYEDKLTAAYVDEMSSDLGQRDLVTVTELLDYLLQSPPVDRMVFSKLHAEKFQQGDEQELAQETKDLLRELESLRVRLP